MREKDRVNLLAVLDAIEAIPTYVRGIATPREFHSARMVFDAALMNFVVVGEMVGRITEDTKRRAPDLDWQKIKDFRNLVAHDYLGVDAEEIWQIIGRDLPALEREVRRLVETENQQDGGRSTHE
jgi:uncharacterized protein with HEPN domain